MHGSAHLPLGWENTRPSQNLLWALLQRAITYGFPAVRQREEANSLLEQGIINMWLLPPNSSPHLNVLKSFDLLEKLSYRFEAWDERVRGPGGEVRVSLGSWFSHNCTPCSLSSLGHLPPALGQTYCVHFNLNLVILILWSILSTNNTS